MIELSPSDKLYLQIMDDLHTHWNPHPGQIKVGASLIKGDVNTLFVPVSYTHLTLPTKA